MDGTSFVSERGSALLESDKRNGSAAADMWKCCYLNFLCSGKL
jgi:hypothetical protein